MPVLTGIHALRRGGGGKGREEGGGENGGGTNLISAMERHIRVCGNEYADGRVAELSEQICALTAETHGKCASCDSSVHADHFVRRAKILRVRVHNIRVLHFLARFYGGQVSYTCGGNELDVALSNTRHTRSVGIIRCCCIRNSQTVITVHSIARTQIFSR